jgi:hypothetical protein
MEVDTEQLVERKSEEEQIKILDTFTPMVYHITKRWCGNGNDFIRNIIKILYEDDILHIVDEAKGNDGCSLFFYIK